MSQTPKADRTLIKQINQNLILQLIQSQGPISRRDLATISSLSPAAVSGITGELIDRGLIQEVGEADSNGRSGRRAILLRLNPRAGFVVGVKLAIDAITCVVTDLDATVLDRTVTQLPFGDWTARPVAPARMIQATIAAIERLLASAQIDRARLLGMGVGVNGIVNGDGGSARWAPLFGWRDVPLAPPLSAHFGIPVHLENDVRTLTIAEQWFGAGRGIDHFVTAVAGYGIGAGVVANGQIYRGAVNGAGEFGHTVLQPQGPRCSCGNHGCLEALAAAPAIFRLVAEALATGEPSLLAGVSSLSLEVITTAADDGDLLAQRILKTCGTWLGIGLANLVNVLNPELLIINGEALCCGHWYLEPMEVALRAHAFDGLADTLRILIAPDGNDLWARGAACVVLSALFTSPMQQPDIETARAVRKQYLTQTA